MSSDISTVSHRVFVLVTCAADSICLPAVVWLVGLLSRASPVRVEFVLHEVALGQVFLLVL